MTTTALLLPCEVAQILDCDRQTAARHATAGRLTAVRTPGNVRRFTVQSVRAALVAGGATEVEADDRIRAVAGQVGS